MQITKHNLHTAQLTNNCPTCFANQGLEFTFSQEETETKYYTKAGSRIFESLYCHSCNNTIYPVNWTDDIERVYQYNKKLVNPKNTTIRLKTSAYLLLLLFVVLVATGLLLAMNY
ncbi:MAG: hypothetical protein K8F54_08315 [Altibacter sp.]|uniref:hypothetical protein n=1 Tax=Altibacter sp. TaxID=2024823 RepID=UPI001D61043B|nr:hypothetical protein [Altibacter sp.]MBZ0327590.1 hypothetical protein [Altibacter sp.]